MRHLSKVSVHRGLRALILHETGLGEKMNTLNIHFLKHFLQPQIVSVCLTEIETCSAVEHPPASSFCLAAATAPGACHTQRCEMPTNILSLLIPFRQCLVINELWHIYNSKTIYYICTLLPYIFHSHSTEFSS